MGELGCGRELCQELGDLVPFQLSVQPLQDPGQTSVSLRDDEDSLRQRKGPRKS